MGDLELKISPRLLAVAQLVNEGSIVADIGTDHGYLPIYLIKSGISPRVIAMDVKKGPLNKAKENVENYGVGDRITLRISDGLDKLEESCDTVTICGMGGRLMARILSDGYDKLKNISQIILSPQSEVPQFRQFLRKNGLVAVKERMILDDGKYYFIMDCKLGGDNAVADKLTMDTFDRFGKCLLTGKDKVLQQFLLKEQKKLQGVRKNVMDCNSDYAQARIEELDYELKCIEKGLEYYEV